MIDSESKIGVNPFSTKAENNSFSLKDLITKPYGRGRRGSRRWRSRGFNIGGFSISEPLRLQY